MKGLGSMYIYSFKACSITLSVSLAVLSDVNCFARSQPLLRKHPEAKGR